MKKYVSMLIVLLSSYFISCNTKSEGGLSATAQKNLDANHAVTKCFETKDFSKLGDYIADDAVDHSGENGEIKGLANLKVEFEKSVAGVDNQKTEIIKELADDEYVMIWSHYTSSYKTDGTGHKAGDKVDIKMVEVTKFKDGKGIEHWAFMEPADVMKMMTNIPASQMLAPGDSTKKK